MIFPRITALGVLAVTMAACKPAETPPAAPISEVVVGGLRVSGAWVRATPIPGVSGAGYMRISNIGNTADTLLGGSTSLAERLEIHQMANVEGVMQMRELPDGVVIPAGGSVELAPSGTHLMLIQVDHALRAGETVPVALRFAKAGTLKLNLPVSDSAP